MERIAEQHKRAIEVWDKRADTLDGEIKLLDAAFKDNSSLKQEISERLEREKFWSQRHAERIRSEWGLNPKYIRARKSLRWPVHYNFDK